MYLGNQRRRSMLGRRNRNHERPAEKPLVCPPVFPVITPRTGLGRSQGVPTLKASQDFVVRKKLFLKSPGFTLSSSGKKRDKGGNLSRAPCNSPNDSVCSFKSDSSLNLTGIRSIRDSSPEIRTGSSSSSYSGKSYQEYRSKVPAIKITSPVSSEGMKISPVQKYNPMEPPKSPGFSHYERLMRIERAKIKQPVDPDDLEIIKYLSIDESSDFNPNLGLKTSTAVKSNKLPNEFSAFVPSKEPDNGVKFSSTLETRDVGNMETMFQSLGVKNTQPSFDGKNQFLDFQSTAKFPEDKYSSLSKGSSESTITNSYNRPSSIFGSFPKSVFGEKPSIFTKSYDSIDSEPKSIVKCTNPESKDSSSSTGDQSQNNHKNLNSTSSFVKNDTNNHQLVSSENLDSKLNYKVNNQTSTNLTEVVSDVKAIDNHFDATSTDLDSTITNQGNQTILSSTKKLSVIKENDEKETVDEDLNSTDSFILAENTMVDQNETILESHNKTQIGKCSLNGMKSIPELGDLSDCDEELKQVVERYDSLKNDVNNLKLGMLKMLRDTEKINREINSFIPSLKKLIAKGSRQKKDENKENMPTTTTKEKMKWFNELKSDYPNMLKTPNPERCRASRLSMANQSVMTPHSLSMVVTDQFDQLFD